MSDNKHLVGTDPAEASNDGRVVTESPVAVEFAEVAEEGVDVVGGLGTFRMPRHLHNIDRIKPLEDLVKKIFAALTERSDLLDKGLGILAGFKPTDLSVQFHKGRFEGQGQ